jgi:hypothetical protein
MPTLFADKYFSPFYERLTLVFYSARHNFAKVQVHHFFLVVHMTSYFFRNWKEIATRDVPEIPSILLGYDHINFRYGHQSSPECWKVIDEVNKNIEVCSSTMFPLSAFLCSVVMGILWGAVIIALIKFADAPLLFISLVSLIGLVVVLGMPTAYALHIWDAMKYWGGPLRMRFTATNKEFFFPRENKTYFRGDYEKIVLGSVGGYVITDRMFEFKGMIMRKNARGIPAPAMIMHYFVLVLTADGSWHRHYLENNAPFLFTKSGSATFDKLVELLQPHVDCMVYHRRYSLKECFYQQRYGKPDTKVLW